MRQNKTALLRCKASRYYFVMNDSSQFILNGQAQDLGQCDPTESLLRWLNRHGKSGTKEGCGDGDCGACTVVWIRHNDLGQAYFEAINSCLIPLGSLPQREVITVEGIANNQGLHPVQQELIQCAGSQCGYCTPGFVMSLFAGFYNRELNDHTIEGNLCRCTGYKPIRQASENLSHFLPVANDPFLKKLDIAPKQFASAAIHSFFSPTNLDEALALKQRHPAAKWITGATDLGVNLSRAQYLAPSFIALDRVTELQRIIRTKSEITIGAGVSMTRIEQELAGVLPAFDQMLPWFAARQIKNRATIGGNLGSASPIGDVLPILLALDAEVICLGVEGERMIKIDDYFFAYRKTACRPEEIILSVKIKLKPALKQAFYKVAKRQTDDISIVAACFALELNALNIVQSVRMGFGGVAAMPLRAVKTETLLLGKVLDEDLLAQSIENLQNEFQPLDDHRASANYRRQLCGNLWAKFIAEHVL